jgi:hypothetical protein
MAEERDLRLVGKSEDGTHLELNDQDGNTYSLRISDNLKSTINAPRLTSVAPVDDRPSYTVKDIQNRLRAGESMDSIARTTDWPLEKIDKFAGPILQERAYIIETALKTRIYKDQSSPLLGEITSSQLAEHGANLEEVEWNTYRNIDGSWNLVVQYPTRNGVDQANWNFDLTNRALDPVDDAASWLIGENKTERPTTPSHGFVAPTEAPRLVAVKESIHIKETVIEDDEIVEELSFDFEEESAPKSDGVTSRPKLPSWDDIMFGSSNSSSNDSSKTTEE